MAKCRSRDIAAQPSVRSDGESLSQHEANQALKLVVKKANIFHWHRIHAAYADFFFGDGEELDGLGHHRMVLGLIG
jgi:hypothetical protein